MGGQLPTNHGDTQVMGQRQPSPSDLEPKPESEPKPNEKKGEAP